MRQWTTMLASLGLCTASAVAGVSFDINEIRIDQSGTDNDEFFELVGIPNSSLNGLTYVVIGDGTGGSGVIEAAISLDGQSTDSNGFFVAAEDTFTLGIANLVTDLAFENGDNVTHLLVTDFSGAVGDDLDTNDNGTLNVTPWSSIMDSVAVILEENPPTTTEYYYGTVTVGPTIDGFVPGQVFRCTAAGDWSIGRFDVIYANDTPGLVNTACPPVDPCSAGVGDCFADNGSAGCDDATCCNAVCLVDPFCCDFGWDQLCADAANLTCAGGDPCGLPGAGNCFTANGSGGCDDAACCNDVCLVDPFCCTDEWTQSCADMAFDLCLGVADDWIINEIHADPADDLPGDANGDGVRNGTEDEFVEIYNNTGAAMDLSGWTISDETATRHIFPAGSVVAADCVVVVFGGGTPIGGFGGALVQTSTEGALFLNNTGDTVTLANALGDVQALAAYGAEGDVGASLTRNPDVTGALTQHDTIPEANGALYSPGTRLDATNFLGCPEPPADFDGDGIPDVDDNCPDDPNPLQRDCDNNGEGDVCELINGTQTDGNGNGLPDECEEDPPANLVINEVRIDHFGADDNEYFELRGDPGTPLDGVTYLVIGDDGGSGNIESVINLDGLSIPADGLFLAAENSLVLTSLLNVDLLLSNLDICETDECLQFENSDNVTHLLVVNFYGQNGQDLDPKDMGNLDVMPWTDELDRIALVEEDNPPMNTEFHYGPPQIGPDDVFVPGHVYRCVADDTWTIGPFDLDADDDGALDSLDTPGAANQACEGAFCDGDVNMDGEVNVSDLLLLLGDWGACVGCESDLDGDDDVDVDDLLIVLGNWGCES